MYLFIFILKSVYGILNFFSLVRFMADLAALSAWSFPLIPEWLGIQYICMSLSFDKFFIFFKFYRRYYIKLFKKINIEGDDTQNNSKLLLFIIEYSRN